MAKSKAANEKDPPSFEAAMIQLEGTVRKLEEGSLSLDDSLAEYAKAMNTIQFCNQQLETARRRIGQLQRLNADGKAIVREWREEEDEETDDA